MDGKNGRPELQTGSVGAVNTGCRHMWGKEFVCVGARPLLGLRTWKMKKANPFTSRHYELTASKGGKSDIIQRTLRRTLGKEHGGF